MGQRIQLSCDKCGYRKTMSVGVGLLSRRPDIIADCLRQDEADEWHRLYSQNTVRDYRVEQKVYYCSQCNDLVCQLTVDAKLADGSEMVFGDKCNTCNGELEALDLQPHHMVCPVCRSGDMTWQQVGLWD